MSEATSPQAQTGATDKLSRRSQISFDDAYQVLSRDREHKPHKISFQRDSDYFCHVEFATDPLPDDYEEIDFEKMNAVNTDDLQLERDGEYRTTVKGERSKKRFTTGNIAKTQRYHFGAKDIQVRDEESTAFSRFMSWHKEIRNELCRTFTRQAVTAMPIHVTLVMTAPTGALGEAERWGATIDNFRVHDLRKMSRAYLTVKIDLPYHRFARQGLFNSYCQALRELKVKCPDRVDLDMLSTHILQENNLDYDMRSENSHRYMERLEQGPDAPGFEDAAKMKNQRDNIDFLQRFVRDNMPSLANHGEELAAELGQDTVEEENRDVSVSQEESRNSEAQLAQSSGEATQQGGIYPEPQLSRDPPAEQLVAALPVAAPAVAAASLLLQSIIQQQNPTNKPGKALVGIWIPTNRKDGSASLNDYYKKRKPELLAQMAQRDLPGRQFFKEKTQMAAALSADDNSLYRPAYKAWEELEEAQRQAANANPSQNNGQNATSTNSAGFRQNSGIGHDLNARPGTGVHSQENISAGNGSHAVTAGESSTQGPPRKLPDDPTCSRLHSMKCPETKAGVCHWKFITLEVFHGSNISSNMAGPKPPTTQGTKRGITDNDEDEHHLADVESNRNSKRRQGWRNDVRGKDLSPRWDMPAPHHAATNQPQSGLIDLGPSPPPHPVTHQPQSSLIDLGPSPPAASKKHARSDDAEAEERGKKRTKVVTRAELFQKFHKGLKNAPQVQGGVPRSRNQTHTPESIPIPGSENWLLQQSVDLLPQVTTLQQDTGDQQAIQMPQLPEAENSAAQPDIGLENYPIFEPDDLIFPSGLIDSSNVVSAEQLDLSNTFSAEQLDLSNTFSAEPNDLSNVVSAEQPDPSKDPTIEQIINEPLGEETFTIPEEFRGFEKDFFGSPSSPPNGELPRVNPLEDPQSDDPPVNDDNDNEFWAVEQFLASQEDTGTPPANPLEVPQSDDPPAPVENNNWNWAEEQYLASQETTGTAPNYYDL